MVLVQHQTQWQPVSWGAESARAGHCKLPLAPAPQPLVGWITGLHSFCFNLPMNFLGNDARSMCTLSNSELTEHWVEQKDVPRKCCKPPAAQGKQTNKNPTKQPKKLTKTNKQTSHQPIKHQQNQYNGNTRAERQSHRARNFGMEKPPKPLGAHMKWRHLENDACAKVGRGSPAKSRLELGPEHVRQHHRPALQSSTFCKPS